MNAKLSVRSIAFVRLGVVLGLVIGGWSRTVQADVVGYAVSRTVSSTQTSNAPPAAPDVWDFRALVFTDVPNEVVSAAVSFNRPPVVAFDLFQTIATAYQYNSTFYASEALHLLDYPVTTYTLTVDRGFGPETGDVFLAESLYCAAIPHFTGDTYDRLQIYNVAAAFSVNFNGFTINPATQIGGIQFSLVQDNAPEGGSVISVGLDPATMSFEIPAGTLLPDTGYSIGLTYFNSVETINAGFGGNANSYAEFYRSTTVYFTTLPAQPSCCPGDFNGDEVVDGLDIQPFVDKLLGLQNCQ